MPRIPDIVPEKLSPEQKKVYDNIVSGPRGQVAGPLRVWLLSPELAERSQALGAFCRFHSSISPRLSELAIIITGHFWRAGYEWATHAPIGIKAGLDPAKVELLRTDKDPGFDKEDEAAVAIAWAQVEGARQRLAAERQGSRAARQAAAGVATEVRLGTRTTLDTLDAEREITAAEIRVAAARRDELVAAFSLLAAMGEIAPEAAAAKLADDKATQRRAANWRPAVTRAKR